MIPNNVSKTLETLNSQKTEVSPLDCKNQHEEVTIIHLLNNENHYKNNKKNSKLIIDYFNNITIFMYIKLYNNHEDIIEKFFDYFIIEEYENLNDIDMPNVDMHMDLCYFLNRLHNYGKTVSKYKMFETFIKKSPESLIMYLKLYSDDPIFEIKNYINNSHYIRNLFMNNMNNIIKHDKFTYVNLKKILNYDFWNNIIKVSSGKNDDITLFELFDIRVLQMNYTLCKKVIIKKIFIKYKNGNYTISLEQYTNQCTDLLKKLENDILKKKSREQMLDDFKNIIDKYDKKNFNDKPSKMNELYDKLHKQYIDNDEPITTFKLHLKNLFNIYTNELPFTVEWCSGCGKRGQSIIDKMYDKLILLKKINDKYFSEKLVLPVKPSISNDGSGGLYTGLSMIR